MPGSFSNSSELFPGDCHETYAPGNPAPVVFVDGSVLPNGWPEGLNETVDASDVHSVRVTCWNPATGEIGGGVGLPLIVVLTKRLVESTRAPIEDLLRAQEAYFSQHSRYAQSLDDLRAVGVPQDVMLEFFATPTDLNGTSASNRAG